MKVKKSYLHYDVSYFFWWVAGCRLYATCSLNTRGNVVVADEWGTNKIPLLEVRCVNPSFNPLRARSEDNPREIDNRSSFFALHLFGFFGNSGIFTCFVAAKNECM